MTKNEMIKILSQDYGIRDYDDFMKKLKSTKLDISLFTMKGEKYDGECYKEEIA